MNYTLRNLLVAAALMLVGIVAITSFIRSERQQLSRDKQEVRVYVAAKDIPAGTPSKDLDSGGFLDTIDVLREDAPPTALGDLADLRKGDVINDTVFKGEILSQRAFDTTAGLNPTAQIKGNERLFSLPIQASNDVAGLIRPGDHVDLVATLTSNGLFKTVMLARDVEIIETPTSLTPEGVEVEAVAPEANGDTKLYVVRATDKEIQNILFGLSASDNNKLFPLLRPGNGDTDTKLTPMAGPTIGALTEGASTGDQVGPDQAVR